jgi:glycosyltransferase involved in cell wall biosynthesis
MFVTVAQRTDAAPSAPNTRAATASPARPPRILTFMYSFAPGGVERVAARLHAAWTNAGADAVMVLADSRIAAPVTITAVRQIGHAPYRNTAARFFALLSGLPALIAERRPEVLFCAGNTYTVLAVALRIVLGRACPPIVAKISNDLVRPDMSTPQRWLYRQWLRLQGRHIDHFIGMAPAMRGEIARFVGVSQSRISIIADPALQRSDVVRLAAARDAATRDKGGRHYLAVGRLARQKNFALLLDAFARIAAPADTLTILGDGVERASLERRAARLGIADAVRMPGHVDPLDAWLAQADALILSSDYEGVPAVLIEGLAAGLPIVATDCCVSMGDLLGHGALGTIVPRGDARALAAAMVAVGPESTSVVAARRAAAAAFTVERAGDRYLAVMRTLVAARAAA